MPDRQWQPGDHVYSQSGNVVHAVSDTRRWEVQLTRCGRPVYAPPWQGGDQFAAHLAAAGKVCRRCNRDDAAGRRQ